ncbi:Cytochrome [Zancudomyces culisetae]|uniref:Cytochrome n=1 Tax=Zancudomyces culisetae TaxID=1213189 RepID=A0A1R1PU16_ZANCU|nr:Cytochrome [Zancudomyces culisetae]|eukprot:OMH84403.1 Cytochrome [Zancudomyces culisetae]
MFSIHGAFCLLKPTKPPYCSRGGVFWRYYVFSGVLYLIERVVREIRGASSNTGRVLKVIQHPSRVVEIQFSKDPSIRYKAGQYVFVNCPAVALHEWHPITLTSSPEEDYFSIHVRIVGDWTKRLAEVLGISDIDQKLEPEISNQQVHSKIESFTKNRRMSVGKTLGLQTFYLPRLQIDGPFGSASEDVFKHEVSMLFGAGIGVTPFASILKSIWYRYNFPNRKNKLKKVYFIWTQRETQSFEWFRDLLKAIEDEEDLYYMRTSMGQDDSKTERTLTSGVIHHRYIDIQVYLTAKLSQKQAGNVMINDVEGFQDAITNLRSPTYFGRPNLKKIFTKAAETHPKTNIGVFFCGPKSLDRSIRSAIEDVVQSGKCTAKFTYKKENF